MSDIKGHWKFSVNEEIARNPNIKLEDIRMFREWTEKQPHLPKLPDHELMKFLVACNYSLEQAKNTLDLNLTMKTFKPEFFSQRDPTSEELKSVLHKANISAMPEYDNDNNIVIVSQLKPIPAADYDILTLMKYGIMIDEMSFLNMGMPNGFVYVIDHTNFTLAHMMRIPLSVTRDFLKYAQECSPCKIRRIHICNGGSMFEKTLSFIKPFMDPQILELIRAEPSFEDLKKSIPARCLPKDFGGEAPSLSSLTEEAYNNLVQHREWFIEEERLRIDETKRLTKSSHDHVGQGTFRKLDID